MLILVSVLQFCKYVGVVGNGEGAVHAMKGSGGREQGKDGTWQGQGRDRAREGTGFNIFSLCI